MKPGLMKNFVKAMGNTPGFVYLKQKVPKLFPIVLPVKILKAPILLPFWLNFLNSSIFFIKSNRLN